MHRRYEERTCVTTRRMEILLFILFIFFAPVCFGQERNIKDGIPVPEGFVRETFPGDSYSAWIRNLPLKDRPIILSYRGEEMEPGFYHVWGVVRMPLLFRSDLEQCADFAMRFWAEYHQSTGKLDQLYLFDYAGRKKRFKKSGQSFAQFLKTAFVNTNSYSLKKGCRTVTPEQLQPGDMFVQNERGGIGHVSIILDTCVSQKGEKLFLIGYSFMPAQEFHIEKADGGYGTEGWFTLEGYQQYLKNFLNYGAPALKRFDVL